MNSDENIKNALQVIYKTYDSVNKMMEQVKAISEEAGYQLKTDKFLRWKSDRDPAGWLLNDFILLFQKAEESERVFDNGWKNAPVYALEICLGVKDDPGFSPALLLSRFEYDSLEDWEEGCPVSDHWGFYQPVHKEYARYFGFERSGANLISIPKDNAASESYWGLKRVVTVTRPLIEITSANLREAVFGSFDRLSALG